MADPFYYNSRTGINGQFNQTLQYLQLKAGIGWHGPFETRKAMLDYYNANKANNPGWKAPTDSIAGGLANLFGDAGSSVAGAVSDGVSGALTGGLSNADLQSWFIRIGEILLGVVLVGVGVAKLTGVSNPISSVVKAKI